MEFNTEPKAHISRVFKGAVNAIKRAGEDKTKDEPRFYLKTSTS